MVLHVRLAEPSDVPAVAALSATHRRRLEGWGSSQWWRRAEGADDIHPLWLGHLVSAPGRVFRVVTDDDRDDVVLAAAVANPQPGQWFVDDVVVADGRWDDAGAVLLRAIVERPALTCAAAADGDRAVALTTAGLRRVSRYWVGPPAPVNDDGGDSSDDGFAPLSPDQAVPPGPPHTFGGSLDPHAPGAIALTDPDGNGSLVVASPSFPAPPVYDPGGTVAVVDRLTGPDGPGLLDAVLGAAGHRGDVLVAVVADESDDTLATLLDDRGLVPIVDVWAWP